MKQYIYNQTSAYTSLDTIGEKFSLKQGDIVTTCDGKMYTFGTHTFALERETLMEWFMRIYTIEESNRYGRIYEQAMLSAMQGMIIKGWTVSESKTVAENAIDFAHALVEELKERDL